MAEWFEEWFNDDYLELYPHRDEAEAARAVALLRQALPWAPGMRVLDVGCGAGRHARALREAGALPVGIDLARALLERARAAGVPLVRADMRHLPIRAGTMDVAVNLFTSFGYFGRDDDHLAVLREVRGALRPDGWFAIDFLNADAVRRGLVPAEERPFRGGTAQITRTLADHGRRIAKTIRLPDGRRFEERVRLFSPPELEAMLTACGFEVAARWGDYDGAPLTDGSPRTILLARATP